MYDVVSASYTFSCPSRGEARVRLSAFRELRRLAGAVHPAVYSVRFACGCGSDHVGLVTHDELDWAPLGLDGPGAFLNVMTARVEPVSAEFGDLAARQIGSGEWPWSFFCYPESRPRPVFPSALQAVAPADHHCVGIAVRCPSCQRISANTVSPEHLDMPFHNDPAVGVVQRELPDADHVLEDLLRELVAVGATPRRMTLH